MFTIRSLLFPPTGFHTYIWIDVVLLKETSRAILIMFDGQKQWLPKTWIVKMRQTPPSLRGSEGTEAISIKISEYYWTKKFS